MANVFFCLALLAATPAKAVALCTLSFPTLSLMSVNVTTGTPYSVNLQITCSGTGAMGQRACINFNSSSGGTWSDDATSRKLPQGTIDTLRYNYYTDSAYSVLWGSWADGYQTQGVQMDLFDGTTNVSVFAKILGSQSTVSSGTYTATLTHLNMVYRNKGGASACPVTGTTATASYGLTATVAPSCTVGVTAMNFGTKGALTTVTDATSTVSVLCSNTAPYSVSLGNGLNGTGPTARKMLNGAPNSVTYGIYSDAARSVAWGSTIGVNTVSGTGNGASQPITAYGRVPIQATPILGTYTDTVVVTVTF